MTAAQEVPYGHNLPPGSRPIEVKAHFFLSDINDINDQAETFEIKGILALQWKDPRYAFDPDREGITEKRYQGTFQFMEMYAGWWPQLVLSNGVEPMSLDNVTLKISPDGTMTFIQEVSEVLESPMNLRRFPFDRQRLKAIFEPLALYASEMRLVSGPEMTDLPERPVRIAGWELLELGAETTIDRDKDTGAEYTILLVTLQVKRHPEYMIWFIMVPLTSIVLLSTSIYWMDHESLESRMDISFISASGNRRPPGTCGDGSAADIVLHTEERVHPRSIPHDGSLPRLEHLGGEAEPAGEKGSGGSPGLVRSMGWPVGHFALNLLSGLYFCCFWATPLIYCLT